MAQNSKDEARLERKRRLAKALKANLSRRKARAAQASAQAGRRGGGPR